MARSGSAERWAPKDVEWDARGTGLAMLVIWDYMPQAIVWGMVAVGQDVHSTGRLVRPNLQRQAPTPAV